IVREGDDYFLIDLKSGNGTHLNGKKIKSIEKHLLRSGDTIKIEYFEIKFTLADEALNKPVEEDTDTDIIEVKMIKKVLRALNKDNLPSLEVLNGEYEGKKIFFSEDKEELDIGRDPQCGLSIDEAVISRRHAKLVRKWGGIALQDLESRNGCYVNNEKIEEKLLRDGDKIMLGTIKFLYRNPQDINVEAIGQEISRKKKEAALREAELMETARKKQEEEERLAREEEERLAQEKAAQEEEERRKAEEAQKAAEDAAQKQNDEALKQIQSETEHKPSSQIKTGLSTGEKIMIAVGALILLAAIGGIILLFI
ncbi:MAG: FHA domain-containing protein, partial [Deltaproteobacteria bacterium]|nr:FHA domain-containing protein [Deltaproteobacteria bacterium]